MDNVIEEKVANNVEDKKMSSPNQTIVDSGQHELAEIVKNEKKRLKRDEAVLKRRREIRELIKTLQEEDKNLNPKLKENRNKARTKFGMQIFVATYTLLGFSEKEKACRTESEYAELKTIIEEKLKALLSSNK